METNMQDRRHRPVTFRGVKGHRRSLEELLTTFYIDGFVSDDEFARDMDLLVNGKMSPEQHREYLKQKYQNAA